MVKENKMPITKSAKKRLRQEKKRRARNKKRKEKIKKLIKRAKVLVSEGNQEQAKKLLPLIYKALDKAAKTKTIKKNTASRKKSRLTKFILNKTDKSYES